MRPTLLLIHGFPLDHSLWAPNISGLSSVANVIAPDLPGFGDTHAMEPMRTMEATAGYLLQLLDARGIDRFVPCGLSMGGYIAMALAEQVPARIAGLILCNTRSTADTMEAKRGRESTAQEAMVRGMHVIARGMAPRVLGATTRRERPDVVVGVEAMIARQLPAAAAAASRAMAQRRDRTDVLRQFHGTALVVTGEEDELMPLATSHHMAEAMSNARLHVLPRAGHLANLEQPAAFNEVVTAYLQNLPR